MSDDDQPEPSDLTDRTVLIAGGNPGLDKALALALADAAGHRLHAITADITRREDVDRMTTEVIDALGRIDIRVNNAGTCYHGDSWGVTDEEWDAVMMTPAGPPIDWSASSPSLTKPSSLRHPCLMFWRD